MRWIDKSEARTSKFLDDEAFVNEASSWLSEWEANLKMQDS